MVSKVDGEAIAGKAIQVQADRSRGGDGHKKHKKQKMNHLIAVCYSDWPWYGLLMEKPLPVRKAKSKPTNPEAGMATKSTKSAKIESSEGG